MGAVQSSVWVVVVADASGTWGEKMFAALAGASGWCVGFLERILFVPYTFCAKKLG